MFFILMNYTECFLFVLLLDNKLYIFLLFKLMIVK